MSPLSQSPSPAKRLPIISPQTADDRFDRDVFPERTYGARRQPEFPARASPPMSSYRRKVVVGCSQKGGAWLGRPLLRHGPGDPVGLAVLHVR
jgi:hypothetical protein